MKRISLVLATVASAAFAAGCADSANDTLLGGGGTMAIDPGSLAAGDGNTHQHFRESIGPDNGILDQQQKEADDQAVGSPEVVARMHGTQKIGYGTLGGMLAGFGVNLGAAQGAGALYKGGGSALGMPIYANRVPEQIVPSTSSLAKEFDIFTAAAPEIIAGIGASQRCTGVMLFDAAGLFTADGVSCLIGKPARVEHVALANQLIGEATTPQVGQQIAVATLLAAAHTSE